jgi:RimJ/RimL family protein N-acetyltransferase
VTPVVETQRLRLRGFRADDLEAVTAFFADPEATRFVGGTVQRPRAHTILSAFAGHWALFGLGQWAVEEKAAGSFCGFVGNINPPDWPEPEIGWSIVPAYQGKGFATEAALAARAAIARLGGSRRLVSFVAPENAPSRRVAEKLGAAVEREIVLRDERLLVYRHPAEDGARGSE